jgi:hypothetical protein
MHDTNYSVLSKDNEITEVCRSVEEARDELYTVVTKLAIVLCKLEQLL